MLIAFALAGLSANATALQGHKLLAMGKAHRLRHTRHPSPEWAKALLHNIGKRLAFNLRHSGIPQNTIAPSTLGPRGNCD